MYTVINARMFGKPPYSNVVYLFEFVYNIFLKSVLSKIFVRVEKTLKDLIRNIKVSQQITKQ